MSTEQCRRLHEAYLFARSRRETKVIALMGGSDFFSNGIHLNVIEAADDPAAESWSNLRAIDDLVREIIETDSHLVLSALAGDAAAGGVPFALAADHVVARKDVVLNPYYQHMGGLYGSEYWTYLLPRRVGAELTARLTGPPFTSLGTRQAVEIGLLDAAFGTTLDSFRSQVRGSGRAPGAQPRLGPGQAAPARARRGESSRSTPIARRSWRARTAASSARTAATTRRAGASSTSSAHRAPSHRRRSHRRVRCARLAGRHRRRRSAEPRWRACTGRPAGPGRKGDRAGVEPSELPSVQRIVAEQKGAEDDCRVPTVPDRCRVTRIRAATASLLPVPRLR